MSGQGVGYVRVIQLETCGAEPTTATTTSEKSKWGQINADAFEQALTEAANGGTITIDEPGTYYLTVQQTLVSDLTIMLGAGVTLDSTLMSSPMFVATSKSNIRLTGDGKLVCVAASVPSFTSCTGLEVSVRIEDGDGALLQFTQSGCRIDRGIAVYPNGRIGGIVDPTGHIKPLGRVERSPGGIFCTWQTAQGSLAMVSTDANDDVALDTTVTLDGLPCVKCTFSDAASGTFIAAFTPTNPIQLKNWRTIHVPIKITAMLTAANVALNTAPFQVWLMLNGGGTIRLQCDAENVPPSGWHVFTFSRSSNVSGGQITLGSGAVLSDLDTITITSIRIVQASVTASASYPVWVGPLRVDARTTGHVSIVMDGEYISQYSILKPILDQYRFKTSLAIVNSNIGASADYMTLTQLDQMYNEGHECIHHTYDGTKQNGYVNATDWTSTAAIANDINQQWEYFRDQGWERGIGKAVNAFANCFVKGTSVARQNLVLDAFRQAGVECSRASTALYTEQMQLGYKPPSPFHLRGAIQITSTDTASAVQTIIDQAENDGTWAIITIHRAVASSPGSLEMTTANFQTWLAYLAARVAAGGIVCAPMGEVYDKFYRQ